MAVTSVLELTAVIVIARAVISFVAFGVFGFVIWPILTPASPAGGDFTTSHPGGFALAGRIFDWADPAAHSLVLALFAALAYLVARHRRTPRITCPHCLAQVLPAATVCFNCTRDLPLRADQLPRMKTDAI